MSVGWGAWLAQSEECATLNLGVVDLSPILGAITKKKKKRIVSRLIISIYRTFKVNLVSDL